MTRRVTKVAISLPADLHRAVEQIRRTSGRSRSAVMQEALRYWIHRRREESLVQQYVAGYRAHPETAAEIETAEAAAVRLLASQEW